MKFLLGYNMEIFIQWGIMKTRCPLGFVVTHALGQMMYGYTLPVPANQIVPNKL